jgi:hypothetical protein
MKATREQRVEQAFFRGGVLGMKNPKYRDLVRGLVEVLLGSDLGPAI